MNQLVIIGNGFDLAHGLKTSYKDFMLWYLNKRLAALDAENKYKDGLCDYELKTSPGFLDNGHIKSIEEYIHHIGKWPVSFARKEENRYFSKLIQLNLLVGWVDIELFYYKELTRILENYKLQKKDQTQIAGLEDLNNFVHSIKTLLVEYLTTINTNSEFVAYYAIGERLNSGLGNSNILFLNFNYTNTIQPYMANLIRPLNKCIHIHGELNSDENPIIFGYGDEVDAKYKMIEDTGVDDFLKFIKSFWYLRTNNYRETMDFLEGGKFQVSIAGHSCGLSDRVLLSDIFTHTNCKSIDIWYHQITEDTNDYTQKSYAISRQFPLEFKGDMRRKIIPLGQSIPLNYKPK
jgi:hypothetical protein